MNSKFIFVFMTIANILFIGFNQIMPVENLVTDTSNLAFGVFTFVNPNDVFGTDAQPGFSSAFTNNISSMLNPGTTVSTFSGFNFIDSIRAILGIIGFILPIPLIAFLFTLSLPIYVLILIGVPIGLLYILGLVEFVRGVQL